jgi:hypothetical protein
VTPNINRGPSHKCKSREDLSIDAVIRRLSTESGGRDTLQLPDGIPPVPALPAFPPLGTHRPRQYPPSSSRRSSMTKRKSPLSNVSSPDGTQKHYNRVANTDMPLQTLERHRLTLRDAHRQPLPVRILRRFCGVEAYVLHRDLQIRGMQRGRRHHRDHKGHQQTSLQSQARKAKT